MASPRPVGSQLRCRKARNGAVSRQVNERRGCVVVIAINLHLCWGLRLTPIVPAHHCSPIEQRLLIRQQGVNPRHHAAGRAVSVALARCSPPITSVSLLARMRSQFHAPATASAPPNRMLIPGAALAPTTSAG